MSNKNVIQQSVILEGSINAGTTAGTPTAYTLTLTDWNALVTQTPFIVKFNVTSWVSPTLNINGTGAIPLLKPDGTAITIGDLIPTGQYIVIYDGTNYVVTNPQPAINNRYVQVRCATVTAGNLATDFEAGDIVDWYTLVLGDAILIKDQASQAQNGIYIVQTSWAPVRAPYYNSSDNIIQSLVLVQFGTVNQGRLYRNTNTTTIVINITPITYAVLSYNETLTKTLTIPCVEDTAVLTTGNKVSFRIPSSLNWYNLVGVWAQLITAPSTSWLPTIQIERWRQATPNASFSYVQMLSTNITIDVNEYDSKDATTPAVINTSNDDVLTGDNIRINVSWAGTGAQWLNVTLSFQLP